MYPYVSPQRFTMNEGLHLKRSTAALKEVRNQNHSNMSAQKKAGIFLLSHSQLPTSLNKIYGVDAKASREKRAEREYASIKKRFLRIPYLKSTRSLTCEMNLNGEFIKLCSTWAPNFFSEQHTHSLTHTHLSILDDNDLPRSLTQIPMMMTHH